jgi:ketosteroid isomerase-like protein
VAGELQRAAPATDRQRTVERYCDAYTAGEYERAVEIFTDDVRWLVQGAFDVRGRDQYLANMSNEHAAGHPTIVVTRYFEDGDSVVAEGVAEQDFTAGGRGRFPFLDVFRFRGDLVCEKRSYAVADGTVG